jgi:hypothetical protein
VVSLLPRIRSQMVANEPLNALLLREAEAGYEAIGLQY